MKIYIYKENELFTFQPLCPIHTAGRPGFDSRQGQW